MAGAGRTSWYAGWPPSELALGVWAALATQVAEHDQLRLRGVMAVAPLGADPEAAFRTLGGAARRIRADHPEADWVSAGMSGDLEAAIAQGATHVRVGTAILGSRPTVR